MPALIRVLPPALASRIAAGEVVERPASVVKELVENSLDAGATRIDVAITAGGIGSIEVVDDGSGMSVDDATLCVERHATSKLTRFEDLDTLGSYGFRGEALPSIASVSRLLVRTRPRDENAAIEVVVEGGAPSVVRPAGAPIGTTILVEDLFYNVPARRKFLRSSSTEAGHVGDVILGAALSRPDVSFTFSRDGRRVRNWPRVVSEEERVRQILDGEELLVCRGGRGPLEVFALLSPPERARQGAGGLRLFINQRPVKDRALAGTIAHAYGSVLERGRYPRGAVYLTLPPQLVDVNAHPQKTEVRFADPRAVTDALHSIVSRSLSTSLSGAPTSHAPERPWSHPGPRRSEQPLEVPGSAATRRSPLAALEVREPVELPAGVPPTNHEARVTVSSGRDVVPKPLEHPVPSLPLDAPSAVETPLGRDQKSHLFESETASTERGLSWRELRFLHQVRQTYLICEGPSGLYVLDQHAAAERVLFSNLRRAYDARDVASQSLLFPVTVEVTPEESEFLEQRGTQVAAMGLDVRVRTAEVVSIHAVPRLLQRGSPEQMLRNLLREISRAGERAFSDAVDKALATMACHGAVRAGDPVAPDEARALLRDLDQADFAGYCPHGRPIVMFTSWAELERKVGRR